MNITPTQQKYIDEAIKALETSQEIEVHMRTGEGALAVIATLIEWLYDNSEHHLRLTVPLSLMERTNKRLQEWHIRGLIELAALLQFDAPIMITSDRVRIEIHIQ